MFSYLRTNSENKDFISLVQLLDKDLSIRNGDQNSFYAQFNKIDLIKNVIIAYANDEAVGCGAFKQYSPGQVEIKRMYVIPDYRGKGIATRILSQLEQWAYELNYTGCVLETGLMQPEAIKLYEKSGYRRISNYGQYQGIAESVCFEKIFQL